jgi:protein gp37
MSFWSAALVKQWKQHANLQVSASNVLEAYPQYVFPILTTGSHHPVSLAGRLHWPANVWVGVGREDEEYRT